MTRGEQSRSKRSHDAESIVMSNYRCTHCERVLVIPIAEVAQWVRMSKRNVYRLVSQQSFPIPIKVGKRKVLWIAREINEWLEQQMRNRA